MKLKNLPKDTNVQTIKVRLSDALYNSSSLPDYGIETKEVYLMGPTVGDWFVKIKLASTRIYPLYRESISWDELKDLEVVE